MLLLFSLSIITNDLPRVHIPQSIIIFLPFSLPFFSVLFSTLLYSPHNLSLSSITKSRFWSLKFQNPSPSTRMRSIFHSTFNVVDPPNLALISIQEPSTRVFSSLKRNPLFETPPPTITPPNKISLFPFSSHSPHHQINREEKVEKKSETTTLKS